MVSTDFQHKQSAILCAEIKDHFCSMEEYELAAVRTCCRQHNVVVSPGHKTEEKDTAARTGSVFRELMETISHKHQGRMLDSKGDNLFANFANAEDAVSCAVEIQQALNLNNARLPGHRKIEFRIGINFGEVAKDGDQILTEGVIIATHIKNLADVGENCISATVRERIEDKLQLRYEFLGEHAVKNITKPFRVYCAKVEPDAAMSISKLIKKKFRRWIAFATSIVLIAAAGTILNSFFHFFP